MWARVAGFVLAAALLLLAMRAVAGFVVETALRHAAERELDALQKGEPRWRWTLQRPRDLVAGRPFGNATASATAQGLRVTSRDGAPFELGLPVMQPLDLAHWPKLRLVMAPTGTAGELSFVAQSRPDEATCSATGLSIPARTGSFAIDLRTLAWRTDHGDACPPPEVIAYMLRLRLRIPAGSELELREAALLAAGNVQIPNTATAAWSAADVPAFLASSDPVSPPMPAAPMLLLPRTASVETWLALRDRIRSRWPGAIVALEGATMRPDPHRGMPEGIAWGITAVYILLLLHAGLRRTHPAWQLALLAAGSLWLIAGMQWGVRASPPAVSAFVAALLWAAWQALRQRPSNWHWLGGQPRDWLMPLLLIPLAWGLAAALGHGWSAPQGRHALLYVTWAGLQQWLMLGVMLRRLEQWPGGRALPILVTAALFALLHTPNGALMQLCFLAELWWAWCFLRSRRLLPIALAHAACALLVEAGLVGEALRSLEVSARFLL